MRVDVSRFGAVSINSPVELYRDFSEKGQIDSHRVVKSAHADIHVVRRDLEETPVIWRIQGHAIDQCRARASLDAPGAIDRILNILRAGVKGFIARTVRLGLECVVVIPDKRRPGYAIAVTYYVMDRSQSLRAFGKIMGQTRKPGRSAAWKRLKRQGRLCRRPPTPPA
jgi:hypothetical protein